MADITSIDKTVARKLGAEVEAAIKTVAEKYGLTVDVRGGTFTENDYTPKVTLKVIGADKATFEQYASWYGLTGDDFGAVFTLNREQFRITGINTRAPKFAIKVARVKDGKGFKAPTEAVLRALGREVKPEFI
jgi:hypothetical protein